jgi:hypothetical protein
LRISAIYDLPRIAVLVLADHARHDLARLDGDRLVDHAALLGVVAHLDVAGDREVLAERVAPRTRSR